MPNVQLDDVATIAGVANFSIRGLGINSSIPSIDPTVGVFVDGMYMGITSGVLLDMFDLESVEVLRGPQGLLFGRNVTGGAVLINTKDPGDEFAVSAKTAVDARLDEGTGPNYYAMASVTGPIIDTLAAKFSMYMNIDEGWHENLFDGRDFGEAETYVARPSIMWAPTEDLELLVKYEHANLDADGPAAKTQRSSTRTNSISRSTSGATPIRHGTRLSWKLIGTCPSAMASSRTSLGGASTSSNRSSMSTPRRHSFFTLFWASTRTS